MLSAVSSRLINQQYTLDRSCVVKSLSCVRLFVTPWTVAHQAPPSMEFSRQEYWSGLPFPSPRDLPNPETEPVSLSLLHWQVHSSLLSQLESPPHTKSLFSCSVTSDCLQPHGLRQDRLPCLSPCPRVCSNSCPLSR